MGIWAVVNLIIQIITQYTSLPPREFQLEFATSNENHFVCKVAFCPGGKILASGSDSNSGSTVKLWNLASGKEMGSGFYLAGGIESLAFSTDGKLLAVSAFGPYGITLWDVKRQQRKTTLEGHKNYVKCLEFSPNGRMLASGSFDKTIKLWELYTEKERASLEVSGEVDSLAFSRNGRSLAAGLSSGDVAIWEIYTSKKRLLSKAYVESVKAVAFHPNDKLLATAGSEGVKIWDLTEKEPKATVLKHPGACSIAFSTDGSFLVVAGFGKVSVWDVATGLEQSRLNLKKFAHPYAVTFNQDGRLLAVGLGDINVFRFVAENPKEK